MDDLNSVTCEPASKLFLTFAQPWWKKVATPPQQTKKTIESGQSSTDLPMRLCYYLGSERTANRCFWPHSATPSPSNIGMAICPGAALGNPTGRREPLKVIQATLLMDPPPAMVRDAVRQLRAVHDFDVPEPLSAAFVNWSADPYGGGFHFWNTHVRSWEVMPRIRRPVPGANVFLCGEAFSAKQGWVEGAIKTAEVDARDLFRAVAAGMGA